jgi:hypothetical protein
MSYTVSVEFPSVFAFGEFEHKVTQIINDGSGTGDGIRDIEGYFTDEDKASRAMRRLTHICNQFPAIDATLSVNTNKF